MTSSPVYELLRGDKHCGPLTAAELKSLARTGRLLCSDKLSGATLKAPIDVAQVAALAQLIAVPALAIESTDGEADPSAGTTAVKVRSTTFRALIAISAVVLFVLIVMRIILGPPFPARAPVQEVPHSPGSTLVDLLAGGLLLSAIPLWIIPIRAGVKLAQAKGLSPHWMWFGVHPLGGWIAYTVLRKVDGSAPCLACGGSFPEISAHCPNCAMPTILRRAPHTYALNRMSRNVALACLPICAIFVVLFIVELEGGPGTLARYGERLIVAVVVALVFAPFFIAANALFRFFARRSDR